MAKRLRHPALFGLRDHRFPNLLGRHIHILFVALGGKVLHTGLDIGIHRRLVIGEGAAGCHLIHQVADNLLAALHLQVSHRFFPQIGAVAIHRRNAINADASNQRIVHLHRRAMDNFFNGQGDGFVRQRRGKGGTDRQPQRCLRCCLRAGHRHTSVKQNGAAVGVAVLIRAGIHNITRRHRLRRALFGVAQRQLLQFLFHALLIHVQLQHGFRNRNAVYIAQLGYCSVHRVLLSVRIRLRHAAAGRITILILIRQADTAALKSRVLYPLVLCFILAHPLEKHNSFCRKLTIFIAFPIKGKSPPTPLRNLAYAQPIGRHMPSP